MKTNIKKYITSPSLAVSLVCFILAGTSFLYSTKHNLLKTQKTQVKYTSTKTISQTPLPTKAIIRTRTTIVTSIPTSLPTTAPTTLPTQQPTRVPTSSPAITVQVSEPNGNISFSLPFHDNNNPCSILIDAKNTGNIKSVTIIHYGQPLNSDYVKEINGYSDNWNFAINGETKPTGCSNYSLNNGNTVTWKYN